MKPISQHGASLVALDIDGTIAPSGTEDVSDAVCGAVAGVRAAGHHVVLASGRSLVGILPVARTLGMAEGWVIASNGAVTARLDPQAPDGYVLHDVHAFDARPVVELARVAFPGVQIAAERVGWGYRVTRLFAPHEINGAQQIVGVEEVAAALTTRLILRQPDVLDLLGALSAMRVTATPAAADWLDVTAPKLSKATALERVRAHLDIDPLRTVAVGDGLNDLQMLVWAGRGVAMSDAPSEVRAAAGEVAGTLDEHGAADVLRSLLSETLPAARRMAESG